MHSATSPTPLEGARDNNLDSQENQQSYTQPTDSLRKTYLYAGRGEKTVCVTPPKHWGPNTATEIADALAIEQGIEFTPAQGIRVVVDTMPGEQVTYITFAR